MATKLPSSGSPPDGQTPGCDTSGLILVHRIFRWLYRELPMLIREVEVWATSIVPQSSGTMRSSTSSVCTCTTKPRTSCFGIG